jgi:hypothetical protein
MVGADYFKNLGDLRATGNSRNAKVRLAQKHRIPEPGGELDPRLLDKPLQAGLLV